MKKRKARPTSLDPARLGNFEEMVKGSGLIGGDLENWKSWVDFLYEGIEAGNHVFAAISSVLIGACFLRSRDRHDLDDVRDMCMGLVSKYLVPSLLASKQHGYMALSVMHTWEEVGRGTPIWIVTKIARPIVRNNCGPVPRRFRHVTPEEARSVLAAIDERGEKPWPDWAWGGLAGVMGAVHPKVTGVMLARELFRREEELLSRVEDPSAEVGLSNKAREQNYWGYVEDAFDNAEYRAKDPRNCDAHRRMFAGNAESLARVRMLWDRREKNLEARKQRFSPWEQLRSFELTGSMSYRADSRFFGQGPATGSEKNEESDWRTMLLATRNTLDHLMFQMELLELQSSGRPTPNWLESYTECIPPLNLLRKQQKRRAREFAQLCETGMRREWLPMAQVPAAALDADRCIAWLLQEPRRAVLLEDGCGCGAVVLGMRSGNLNTYFLDGPENFHLSDEAYRTFQVFSGASEHLSLMTPLVKSRPEDRSQIGFDAALCHMRDWLERALKAAIPLAARIASVLEEQGIRRLAVLQRGRGVGLPWEAVPLSTAHRETLGDRFDIVRIPTLGTANAPRVKFRTDEVNVVGALVGQDDSLDLGRVALAASGVSFLENLDTDRFAVTAAHAGILRIFAHAVHNPYCSSNSALFLGHDSRNYVNGAAVLQIDLSRCRRVELWACESAVSSDFWGVHLGQEEKRGLDTAFLLAGAHRVVGAAWVQPSMTSALMAASFRKHSVAGDAWQDACVLASARREVADLLGPGGVFVRAAADVVRAKCASTTSAVTLEAEATSAGFLAALHAITGNLPTCSSMVDPSAMLFGRIPSADEEELARVRANPEARILEKANELRSPFALGGWRVTARDGGCL